MSFDRHRSRDGEMPEAWQHARFDAQEYLRSLVRARHPPTAMLSDVLAELDEPSLSHLVHDHEASRLEPTLAEKS